MQDPTSKYFEIRKTKETALWGKDFLYELCAAGKLVFV